jgi:heme/copper-type cytochrome/quinol oxidase subunit 2
MIQPITIVTAGIFFLVLFFRYRGQPKNAPPRKRSQRLKLVKVLFAAILAWLAIHYSLQHTLARMDGADPEPSMMERLVSFLSK